MPTLRKILGIAAVVALGSSASWGTVLECSEGPPPLLPAKGAATNLPATSSLEGAMCYANPDAAAPAAVNHKQTLVILSGAFLGLVALRRSRLR